jgi:hypothetical protein
LGAVLENDKALFRLLRPSEITWDTKALQQLDLEYTAEGDGKTVLPINEIDEFMDILPIRLDPSVVTDAAFGGNLATVSSEVPLVLKTAYDYDLISYYFTASVITSEQG